MELQKMDELNGSSMKRAPLTAYMDVTIPDFYISHPEYGLWITLTCETTQIGKRSWIYNIVENL